MKSTKLRLGFGTWASLGVAIAVTWLTALGMDSLGPNDWQGWRAMWPAVTAAAWVGVWAWGSQRWTIAALCHTATAILAPWGYLYPGPLTAIVLALSAIGRASSEAANVHHEGRPPRRAA